MIFLLFFSKASSFNAAPKIAGRPYILPLNFFAIQTRTCETNQRRPVKSRPISISALIALVGVERKIDLDISPTPPLIFSERELMFMFAICRRPSVCRLSSVCNVRAPYSVD